VPRAILQRLRAGRFRHVVFASGGFGTSRAVDLATLDQQRAYSDIRHSAFNPEEEAFVRWLLGRMGVDAGAYRVETLRRRLPACMRALHVSSPRAARLALEANPSLVPVAVSSLIIGVTSFFRDSEVFDQLTINILPSIFVTGRFARIWSAGCSDGEEPYSLAMLLAEMKLLNSAYMLGTDCRIDAIRRAREGCYDSRALRDVPQRWVQRYFAPDSRGWKISAELRSAIAWRTADVLSVHEPGSWDMIFFRNVAMYMRTEVAARLWERLEQSLRPGGYLVLGKAERPVGAARLSPVTPCIYRRDRG